MDIGQLNQIVRFEKATSVADPVTQGLVSSWAEFITVPANVKDVLPSNAEEKSSVTRIGHQPSRIRIRYTPGITSDMRVILLERNSLETRIVAGPAILGRNEGIELMVEAYSVQGSRV